MLILFKHAFLALIIPLFFSPSAPPASGGVTVLHMEQEILFYVNRHRKAHHLDTLTLNETESAVALQHSVNMASGKTPFGHDGLEARAKTLRKQLGSVSAAGENVAEGPMSAEEVVDGWLHSAGHKRNIEGDFKLTGIGCAKDKRGQIYFTQIFTR